MSDLELTYTRSMDVLRRDGGGASRPDDSRDALSYSRERSVVDSDDGGLRREGVQVGDSLLCQGSNPLAHIPLPGGVVQTIGKCGPPFRLTLTCLATGLYVKATVKTYKDLNKRIPSEVIQSEDIYLVSGISSEQPKDCYTTLISKLDKNPKSYVKVHFYEVSFEVHYRGNKKPIPEFDTLSDATITLDTATGLLSDILTEDGIFELTVDGRCGHEHDPIPVSTGGLALGSDSVAHLSGRHISSAQLNGTLAEYETAISNTATQNATQSGIWGPAWTIQWFIDFISWQQNDGSCQIQVIWISTQLATPVSS